MPYLDVKFFDGQVAVKQPSAGYRAGTDAILLAASLDAKPGAHILELGCGTGVVMLLARHHLPDCSFTGLEKSADMLALSRDNTDHTDNIEIVEGSIRKIPKDWHLQFDQVVANPPYFDNRRAVRMSEAKESAFVNKGLTLDDWIGAMLLALKPRGIGTLIYRADGLEKICVALAGKAGRLRIQPIHSYADTPAKRIIVQFRKSVKSESALLPALVMHERGTEEKYAPQAAKILTGKSRLVLS
ncbi:MAG: methyltransferase domain-containing protein [Robiginitomaculum sp.]|nr:methyltransferase domain-containing protein [Robiginitomaculum sp.]